MCACVCMRVHKHTFSIAAFWLCGLWERRFHKKKREEGQRERDSESERLRLCHRWNLFKVPIWIFSIWYHPCCDSSPALLSYILYAILILLFLSTTRFYPLSSGCEMHPSCYILHRMKLTRYFTLYAGREHWPELSIELRFINHEEP